MAGIKFEAFQGLVPRTSDRLLPNMAATVARNTKLLSGEIRGFRQLEEVVDLGAIASPLRRAMQVPSTAVATPGDDCWDDVILLAKFDGADAATAYTEIKRSTVGNFRGNAQLDDAQQAAGTTSLLLDGTGDAVFFGTTAGDWAAYQLANTDDVTVEGFFRFNTLPTTGNQVALVNAANQDFVNFDMEIRNNGGQMQIRGRFGIGTFPSADVTLSTGVWYHIVAQRRYNAGSPQVDLFLDGTRVSTTASANNPTGGTEEPIRVGAWDNASNETYTRVLDGWADSVRVTKCARYGDVASFPAVDADYPENAGGAAPIEWLAFNEQNLDIVRSPLINDAFDRYYWAGENNRPSMNTAERIANGDPEYWLGIPVPGSAPGVTPPGGTDETRAYVYTFVSEYGEEGPPSEPTLIAGGSGTPWDITTTTTVPDAAFRNVTTKKIYRTVPGNATTSFFFVAEIPVGQALYSDNETNETVASNPLLESTEYLEPPSDMVGMVVMPNGYLVGFVGRRLLFSEPYRPHAWPASYELATEFEIVGLGVIGSTLIVCTRSKPEWGQGVSPAAFTTQKIDAVEPCLSRRSIVTTPAGLYYASINGLVLATPGNVTVVTKDLFTKSEWADLMPQDIYAAALGLQYIAFNSSNFGFIVDPENPTQRHVELDNFSNVEGIETDPYSGNVLILANDRVYDWDPESILRLQWRWQSKVYQTPKPLNFGAARLKFDFGDASAALPVETVFRPYNEALFTAINGLSGTLQRLNTLGGQPLGGTPAKPQTGLVPTQPSIIENKQPLGGSLMYNLQFLQLTTLSVRLQIKVQPDSEQEQVIFDKQIFDEEIFRLPTGFKSDLWQFNMTGNTTVYSLQVAETPRQLAEI
jgi:hypothetical protein